MGCILNLKLLTLIKAISLTPQDVLERKKNESLILLNKFYLSTLSFLIFAFYVHCYDCVTFEMLSLCYI